MQLVELIFVTLFPFRIGMNRFQFVQYLMCVCLCVWVNRGLFISFCIGFFVCCLQIYEWFVSILSPASKMKESNWCTKVGINSAAQCNARTMWNIRNTAVCELFIPAKGNHNKELLLSCVVYRFETLCWLLFGFS